MVDESQWEWVWGDVKLTCTLLLLIITLPREAWIGGCGSPGQTQQYGQVAGASSPCFSAHYGPALPSSDTGNESSAGCLLALISWNEPSGRINLAGLACSVAGCWEWLLLCRAGNFNTSASESTEHLLGWAAACRAAAPCSGGLGCCVDLLGRCMGSM